MSDMRGVSSNQDPRIRTVPAFARNLLALRIVHFLYFCSFALSEDIGEDIGEDSRLKLLSRRPITRS
jgi:hypothetical protein